MKDFPPRLHILLARDAPIGLVLRRGPAKAVCAIGWDRERDTFQLGQWLRGRIYERRSDLSPDGKHAIYFAMNGQWSSPARGAWTAISRAPYLHAVALYAKGDCWHGGGLFVDNKTYWLNDGYGHALLADTGEVRRADPAPYAPIQGGEDWGVYFHRLARDGWTMRPDLAMTAGSEAFVTFEKPLWQGWRLRRTAHASVNAPPGKGVYWDEHDLAGPGDRLLQKRTWEWADVDRDRLVWAEAGKLFAARITKTSTRKEEPLDDVRELHDFSAMTFEAIAAPYAGAAKPAPKPPAKHAEPTPKAKAKAQMKAKAKASVKMKAKATAPRRKRR